MATIRFTEQTIATPEQFVAALTDFGPDRQQLFGNSSGKYLKVHEKGVDHADVTEGSAGIWERLRYDWSDPARVVMTTVDSNLWGGRSSHTYTFTPLPDGRTQLDVVVVREGKNIRGRLAGLLVASVGKGVLRKALESTIKAVEARNQPSPA
jgi:hypothetical protein